MKKLFILLGVMALMVAVFAATGLAAPPGGGGGAFCSPWTWSWFKTGNGWWYYQWYQWCWNPQDLWTQIWGSWGWA